MQQKVNGGTKSEDAVKAIQEFEQIIKKKECHHMVSLLSRPNISKV